MVDKVPDKFPTTAAEKADWTAKVKAAMGNTSQLESGARAGRGLVAALRQVRRTGRNDMSQLFDFGGVVVSGMLGGAEMRWPGEQGRPHCLETATLEL